MGDAWLLRLQAVGSQLVQLVPTLDLGVDSVEQWRQKNTRGSAFQKLELRQNEIHRRQEGQGIENIRSLLKTWKMKGVSTGPTPKNLGAKTVLSCWPTMTCE